MLCNSGGRKNIHGSDQGQGQGQGQRGWTPLDVFCNVLPVLAIGLFVVFILAQLNQVQIPGAPFWLPFIFPPIACLTCVVTFIYNKKRQWERMSPEERARVEQQRAARLQQLAAHWGTRDQQNQLQLLQQQQQFGAGPQGPQYPAPVAPMSQFGAREAHFGPTGGGAHGPPQVYAGPPHPGSDAYPR